MDGNRRKKTQVRPKQRKSCWNCGGVWPHDQARPCEAKNKQCRACLRYGHFYRYCRSTSRSAPKPGEKNHQRVQKLDEVMPMTHGDSSDEYVYALASEEFGASKQTPEDIKKVYHITRRPKTTVKVNKCKLAVILDSGASVNLVDKQDFDKLSKQNASIKLLTTNAQIFAYGAENPLSLLGKFEATVESVGNITVATFYVTRGNHGSLLGHETATELGLIKVEPKISAIAEQPSTVEKLKTEYQDIFQGIGKLKDFQFEIHVDENVEPVAQAPRRIPFHIRKQVENELDRLEKEGIIEKVDGPTPWVSQIVAAPKPNNPKEIRLCVDLRQVNKAVKRQRNPTPTIEEVTSDLNGATVFSKLDLRAGYHQVELKPASRYLTTFATHKGLMRYTRLIFGLSSASEVFQRVIQQALQGISGVKNISDDVIIFGRTQEEHDQALAAVFQRLREKGLTLNGDKCVFNKHNLAFFGYVFSEKGMSADPKKVEAIKNAAPPSSASEVRSFLGLTGFCSRFIPDYATLTEPLKELTRKGTSWQWGPRQQNAFDQLKVRLTDNNVMAYFDPRRQTVATFDASPFGLGGVLTQVDSEGKSHVVAYASRTLTDVERRYSQTEREALSIVWGCERFHLYLYGAPFEIITDHRPLELIFNNPSSKPPARIERWGLRLQPYDYKVTYKPGNSNIADYLSRHPLQSQPVRDRNIAEQYVNYLIDNAVPKAMSVGEINSACETDSAIQKLRRALTTDKWDKRDPDLQPFYKLRHELTAAADSNIVLRGTRIVIPASLRNRSVQLAHEGHQGVVKTKQLLRQKVWYPGLDSDVEQAIANCIPCQAVGPAPKPEPLKMTELPDKAWLKISTDFCGPFPSGEYLLVVIDEYSRYPEVEIVRSTAAATVIPKFDRIFATHGIPDEVKSDNGPPFNGHEFARFAQEKGFHHRKITPLWAPANSEAERFMRTVEKSIRTSTNEGKNWKQELQQFLLQYRATPHTTTGKSPAELLFGRQIRTKLPEATHQAKASTDHEVRQRDHSAKQKMKQYSDMRHHHAPSAISIGDTVLLKQQRKNKLSTRFDPDPVTVIGRKGSMITLRKGDGTELARNVSHAKKVTRQSAEKWPHAITDDSDYDDDDYTPQVQQPPVNMRPVRERRPPRYLRDYCT